MKKKEAETVREVEKSAVDTGKQKAAVRVLFNMASAMENNPGSLIWGEQVTGESDGWKSLNLGEKALVLWYRNKITGTFIGALLGAVVILGLYRRVVTPR